MTNYDDEREAHDHSGQPRLWCETHQHTHIATVPRYTYLCKDCGWGQWYGDQAREHEYWTQENLRYAHTTYEVEHIMRPLGDRKHPEPKITDQMIRAAREVLDDPHDDWPAAGYWDRMARAVLEAALRVSVSDSVSGEGEQ